MKKKKNINIAVIGLIGLMIFSNILNSNEIAFSKAYGARETLTNDNNAHWKMTKQAIDLMSSNLVINDIVIKDELNEYKVDLNWGSYYADFAELGMVGAGDTKYHFYDPYLDTGKDVEIWDDDALLMDPGFWASSKDISERWFANALKAYSNGEKNKAFYWLGRALHLLQDAFSPMHTDAFSDAYSHPHYEELLTTQDTLKRAIDEATPQDWVDGWTDPSVNERPGFWVHKAAWLTRPFYDIMNCGNHMGTAEKEEMIEAGKYILPHAVGATLGYLKYFYEQLESVRVQGRTVKEFIPGHWDERTVYEYGVISAQPLPGPPWVWVTYGWIPVGTETVWDEPDYKNVYYPELIGYDLSELSWFDSVYGIPNGEFRYDIIEGETVFVSNENEPFYNMNYFDWYKTIVQFADHDRIAFYEFKELIEVQIVGSGEGISEILSSKF